MWRLMMVFICVPAVSAARRKSGTDSQVISDLEIQSEGCPDTIAEYRKHMDAAKVSEDAANELLPAVNQCHGNKLKMATKMTGRMAILKADQTALETKMAANQGLVPKIRKSATDLHGASQQMLIAHTQLKTLCFDPDEGLLRDMVTSGKIATLSAATDAYKTEITEVADALQDVRAVDFLKHVDKMGTALAHVKNEWNFVAPSMMEHAIKQDDCIPPRLFFNNTDYRTQVRKQFGELTDGMAEIYATMKTSLQAESVNVNELMALSK